MGLPEFLVSLAVDGDWTEEQPCFDGIARALGKFYSVQPPDLSADKDSIGGAEAGDLEGGTPGRALASAENDAAATGAAALERRAKHVIYPALRSYLEPPTSLAEAGAVLKIASTASLYRVFERC